VDVVDKGRPDLLADHRAGDAAIGEPVHAVLGEGGVAVTVVDADDQLVVAGPHVDHKAERRVASLVLAQVLAVEPHARQVGDRAKGELGLARKGALERPAVPGDAVIVEQAELGVPAAGDGDPPGRGERGDIVLRCLFLGVGAERPPAVQDYLFTFGGSIV
jgi:hypothetical protein